MKSTAERLLTVWRPYKSIQIENANECCHICVDLTLMIPHGGNGGIKPAILALLEALAERFRDAVRFTLLVNSSTYSEVEFLVRARDSLVCVAFTHDCPWPTQDSTRPYLSVCPAFSPANLSELGIDVFYCPFGPTNRSAPGIPTIAMVTDLLHRDYPFSIPEQERIWREEYFKDILADVDYVQCISQYTVDRLLEYYRINKDRVFFTHLPIEHRLKSGFKGLAERAYFIYPANFWIHKNHEVLLIAYRIYRETVTDPWDLLLTGALDARARQIQDLATTLGISENVRFTGYVDGPVFSQFLEGAAALIYPSLYEGFGIPLIEAMRFRKPIICSKSGSVPEVAGDAAICVDGKKPLELAGAMVQLTENSAIRDQLVSKGDERLRMFSIEAEVNKLYDVFTTAKRSNSTPAKLLRALRRSQKWDRLLVRKWKTVTQPSYYRSEISKCLVRARARFRAAKEKAHRVRAKITSLSSWKL